MSKLQGKTIRSVISRSEGYGKAVGGLVVTEMFQIVIVYNCLCWSKTIIYTHNTDFYFILCRSYFNTLIKGTVT